ncbi:MAG: hypothetical protein ABW123_14080 [Cystobacter sp.]
MRPRSASRLSLVPRSPESPDDAPEAPRSGEAREHLAPPHRATRRPPPAEEGMGALLLQGLVSAGIGAVKNSALALRGLGFGASPRPRGHIGLGRSLARLLLDVPLSMGGRLVSGVQTRLGLEPRGCRLGARQILELRRVFGNSIDYARVSIKIGRLGLLSLPRRPFVLGNTVYVPSRDGIDPAGGVQRPLHLLVRELTRVWQYQYGGTDYTCQTLGGRWFADPSDWRAAMDEGRSWAELEPEQQAQFLQTAYTRSTYFRVPGHRFIDADSGVDYTPQLEAALELLRGGHGAP